MPLWGGRRKAKHGVPLLLALLARFGRHQSSAASTAAKRGCWRLVLVLVLAHPHILRLVDVIVEAVLVAGSLCVVS